MMLQATDHRTLNILIVEDNVGDYVLVKEYLSEYFTSHHVHKSKDFKDAKAVLEIEQSVFDIILLDLSLPDLSGESLITAIKKLAKSASIIVLTGFSNIEFSIKSLSLGVDDYLVKDDLTPLHLYKSISYSLERKQAALELIKATIAAQEEERQEIGIELHDNVCQTLVASLIVLGRMSKKIDTSLKPYVAQADEYTRLALRDIRNLSHRLAPLSFDHTTLEEAFKSLIDSFNTDKLIEIEVSIEGFKEEINRSDVILNLYRILQEQLQNIFKHAHAKKVRVEVVHKNSLITLIIRDNGIGFDASKVVFGIGFRNIKKRVDMEQGVFSLTSSPRNGCVLKIEIPV